MKLLLYAVLVALLMVSATSAYTYKQIEAARHTSRAQTCSAFEAYNRGFVRLIRDGEKVLPTLAYYKKHTDELARAIASDERAIRVITGNLPDYC